MAAKQYTNEPNSLIAWSNRNKTRQSQPDYTGKVILPDGKEMSLAIWVNKTQNGGTMLNGHLSFPQQNGNARQAQAGGYQPAQAAPAPATGGFSPEAASEVAAFRNDFIDGGDDLPL